MLQQVIFDGNKQWKNGWSWKMNSHGLMVHDLWNKVDGLSDRKGTSTYTVVNRGKWSTMVLKSQIGWSKWRKWSTSERVIDFSASWRPSTLDWHVFSSKQQWSISDHSCYCPLLLEFQNVFGFQGQFWNFF